MAEEKEGVMDESLASEEQTAEPEEEQAEAPAEEPEEEPAEETEEEDESRQGRAFARMRRENRQLREELLLLKAQAGRKEEEKEPELPDDGYLTAGQVKQYVQQMVAKVPKPDTDGMTRTEILNLSESIAKMAHSDYAEVTNPVKEMFEEDPGLREFIIGKPGTYGTAAERLYQFGLMRKNLSSKRTGDNGNRKKTIDAIVKEGKKPATMGLQSKKAPSQKAVDIANMDIDQYRAAVKKNPDLAKKVLGE